MRDLGLGGEPIPLTNRLGHLCDNSASLPNICRFGNENRIVEAHVRLLADGFHVDSYIPGGERMQLSGTSMAAPQVTNLAAKLMALDPSLTPGEVIDLMIEGGEKVERNGRPHILLNPAGSVKLLRDR